MPTSVERHPARLVPTPAPPVLDALVRQRDGAPFVTITMPTHAAGPERRQDAVRLRNLLRTAEAALAVRDDVGDPAAMLAPAAGLLEDGALGIRTDAGLAIHLNAAGAACCVLPYAVPERVAITDAPALRHLVPVLTHHVDAWLLTLSAGGCRLFQVQRTALERRAMQGVPTSLDALMAFIDVEKSLQHHGVGPQGARAGNRRTVFHGHGANVDDDGTRIHELLVLVERGLPAAVRGAEGAPLLLAGEERIVSAFRGIPSSANIVEPVIGGNVDHLGEAALLERVRPVLADLAAARRARMLDRYRAANLPDRATEDIDIVERAAALGQVDLLVASDTARAPIGADPFGGEDAPAEAADAVGDDRIERAVADVLRTGGDVLVLPDGDLPDGFAVGALLRPGGRHLLGHGARDGR